MPMVSIKSSVFLLCLITSQSHASDFTISFYQFREYIDWTVGLTTGHKISSSKNSHGGTLTFYVNKNRNHVEFSGGEPSKNVILRFKDFNGTKNKTMSLSNSAFTFSFITSQRIANRGTLGTLTTGQKFRVKLSNNKTKCKVAYYEEPSDFRGKWPDGRPVHQYRKYLTEDYGFCIVTTGRALNN